MPRPLSQRPGYIRPSTGAELLRRGRAAAAERIAIAACFGLALVSGSFAAYSITGSTNTYSVQPFLPALGGGFAWKRNATPVREAALDLDPTTTGSLPERTRAATDRPDPAPSARGYVLRGVGDGSALVEGPEGLRQVVPGAVLPGAGRILSIRATGAGWVVITSETIIGPTPL